MIGISKLASSVQPSATLAAGAKARALRAAGVTVYDFSLGEPDQNTPEHICTAAHKAMLEGQTHYTAAAGTLEVRKAIANWYAHYHQYSVKPDQILVSNGAKQSIHNALAATLDPGDEVIIPTPYWVSYSDLVAMKGAIPVLVHTTPAQQFKLTPATFREHVTPKTKLVMLNSPCNPTGTTYTRAELQALTAAILETNVAILSDEIYEQLCYGDLEPTCIATLDPRLPERTITISGASKSYAMTGWRMGWAIAPVPVIQAMTNIQSQETGCASSVSQAALQAALEGPQECVATMKREYLARREFVVGKLNAIAGLKLFQPTGAFYAFFDVTHFFGQTLGGTEPIRDSIAFCTAALERAHVNLVPGAAFGCEGFARMSFAASREQLEGGLAALANWLNEANR